jgi:hypothetical protein
MTIKQEDKVELARKRAELVTSLAGVLPAEERVRIQGELSIINAKIKAQNTMEAARLKVTADRRKAVGIAEAQANAARARANVGLSEDESEDDDPGQTAAIDGWIDSVLLRHDVDFTRSPSGALALEIEPKWAAVIGTLVDGVYAAARGQELPDLPSAELRAVKAAKVSKAKPKKRP